jgi:hypothetical protein
LAPPVTLLQAAHRTDKLVKLRGHWARSALKESFVLRKLYRLHHFFFKSFVTAQYIILDVVTKMYGACLP